MMSVAISANKILGNMASSLLYSVILPTYNEKDNLPIIFYLIDQTFTKSGIDYEVVVVDDNSPDGTAEVAKKIQSSYGSNRLKLVCRSGKLGLGTAYVAGLQASRGHRIILMDADLSHHPKFIRTMIQVMDTQRVEIVTGTRYAPGGGVAGWDMKRKMTSRGANFLATFLLNTGGVSDVTGSFRLYERNVLTTILPQIQSTGYAFQMEIIIRSNRLYKIAEVPITFVDRVYGESKLGTREIMLYLKGLIKLFFTT
jgi:dolichol-phosphate mannosyltransferase